MLRARAAARAFPRRVAGVDETRLPVGRRMRSQASAARWGRCRLAGAADALARSLATQHNGRVERWK
jgi:hypothetical protein